MKRLRRLAIVVSGALLAGYLLVCAMLFAVQRQITFAAPKNLLRVIDGSKRIEVPDGTFFLWRIAPGGGPVVVHFHGNGEQVSYVSWLAAAWQRNGASFAAVEYPGYPGASGEATEASIVSAAEAALVHLTVTMGIERSRIVISGQSLGTGVAVTMAARGWGIRLVLISPYTSLPDVADRAFPWLPTTYLLLDRFDSQGRAGQVKVPTLIVHGSLDSVVPIDLGKRLGDAIQGSRFVTISGGHHHDLLDRDAAQETLFAFVRE